MNFSSNVGVGVAAASNDRGRVGSAVCVGRRVGGGAKVGVAPPSGVGVAYCPHSDGLPPHAEDASMNEATIKRLIARFTKYVRCRELYLYKLEVQSLVPLD